MTSNQQSAAPSSSKITAAAAATTTAATNKLHQRKKPTNPKNQPCHDQQRQQRLDESNRLIPRTGKSNAKKRSRAIQMNDSNNYSNNTNKNDMLSLLFPSIQQRQRMIYSIGILIVTIVTSVLINRTKFDTATTTATESLMQQKREEESYRNNNDNNDKIYNFLQNFCRQSYCHELLQPRIVDVKSSSSDTDTYHHRTQQTVPTPKATTSQSPKQRMIRANDIVLRIPRHLTIFDIDAIQDPWIQRNMIQPLFEYYHNNVNNDTMNATTNNTMVDTDMLFSPPVYLATYLARSIQQLQQQANHVINRNSNDTSAASSHTHTSFLLHPLLQQYLMDIVPSYEYYQKTINHPVLWTMRDTDRIFQYDTYNSQYHYKMASYYHIMDLRKMIRTEYDTFRSVSNVFSKEITYEMYVTSRLHVLTRSFGSGGQPETTTLSNRMHSKDHADDNDNYNNNKLENLVKELIDLIAMKGSHVMVPILDLYNHHGNPNVEFRYTTSHAKTPATTTKRNANNNNRNESFHFRVTATRDIPSGYEIWDSYGKRTDSDLYARYGFINYDGSDYTQCSLALYHNDQIDYIHQSTVTTTMTAKNNNTLSTIINDVSGNSHRRYYKIDLQQRILKYLQYDDGYGACIIPAMKSSWDLKVLKFRYLLYRSNLFKHWVAVFPPRNKNAVPPSSLLQQSRTESPATMLSKRPPSFDDENKSKTNKRNIQVDANFVFSTCRVITLTEYDYNGHAAAMLKEQLYNYSYTLPRVDDSSLEFRTLLCIARMTQTALSKFPYNRIEDQYNEVYRYNTEDYNNTSSSTNRMDRIVANLRLGEMQSLQALKQIAFAQIRRQPKFMEHMDKNNKKNENDNANPEYTMRDKPCSLQESMLPLLYGDFPESQASIK